MSKESALELCKTFELRTYQPFDRILRQGEKFDMKLYVLLEGAVVVVQQQMTHFKGKESKDDGLLELKSSELREGGFDEYCAWFGRNIRELQKN